VLSTSVCLNMAGLVAPGFLPSATLVHPCTSPGLLRACLIEPCRVHYEYPTNLRLVRAPALRPAGRRRFAPTFDFAPGKIVEPQVLIPAACRGYNRLVIYHVFHALIWLGCQDYSGLLPSALRAVVALRRRSILLPAKSSNLRFSSRPPVVVITGSSSTTSFMP